jgi:hypothetical protein
MRPDELPATAAVAGEAGIGNTALWLAWSRRRRRAGIWCSPAARSRRRFAFRSTGWLTSSAGSSRGAAGAAAAAAAGAGGGACPCGVRCSRRGAGRRFRIPERVATACGKEPASARGGRRPVAGRTLAGATAICAAALRERARRRRPDRPRRVSHLVAPRRGNGAAARVELVRSASARSTSSSADASILLSPGRCSCGSGRPPAATRSSPLELASTPSAAAAAWSLVRSSRFRRAWTSS